MIPLLLLLAMGGMVCAILYLSLYLYLRAVRRDRLEAEWLARPVGEREDHVERGLAAGEWRLRRALLISTVIVPMTALILLVIGTNS